MGTLLGMSTWFPDSFPLPANFFIAGITKISNGFLKVFEENSHKTPKYLYRQVGKGYYFLHNDCRYNLRHFGEYRLYF